MKKNTPSIISSFQNSNRGGLEEKSRNVRWEKNGEKRLEKFNG
jgi:hypothetical protein